MRRAGVQPGFHIRRRIIRQRNLDRSIARTTKQPHMLLAKSEQVKLELVLLQAFENRTDLEMIADVYRLVQTPADFKASEDVPGPEDDQRAAQSCSPVLAHVG